MFGRRGVSVRQRVLTGSEKQFCQPSYGHGRGSVIPDGPRISDAHERVCMLYLRHCELLRRMAMRPETTRLPRAKGARVESEGEELDKETRRVRAMGGLDVRWLAEKGRHGWGRV